MGATFVGEPPVESAEPRASAVSDSSLRVDVHLLDKLMTLVGELELARNQIIQFSGSQEDAGFLGMVQRLNLLTTELQTGVMKTRMQQGLVDDARRARDACLKLSPKSCVASQCRADGRALGAPAVAAHAAIYP